jgi:hypothetical protein
MYLKFNYLTYRKFGGVRPNHGNKLLRQLTHSSEAAADIIRY